MLLSIIFLWLTGVFVAFLIKGIKFISTPDLQQQNTIEEKQDTEDDSIIGSIYVENDEDLKNEDTEKENDDLPIDEIDEGQNQRVEEHCAEENLNDNESDPEEDLDACSVDDEDRFREAVGLPPSVFETEVVRDPDKLAELLRTDSKLSNSSYYNKLKENENVSSNSERLADIAVELYAQRLKKSLSEQ